MFLTIPPWIKVASAVRVAILRFVREGVAA